MALNQRWLIQAKISQVLFLRLESKNSLQSAKILIECSWILIRFFLLSTKFCEISEIKSRDRFDEGQQKIIRRSEKNFFKQLIQLFCSDTWLIEIVGYKTWEFWVTQVIKKVRNNQFWVTKVIYIINLHCKEQASVKDLWKVWNQRRMCSYYSIQSPLIGVG